MGKSPLPANPLTHPMLPPTARTAPCPCGSGKRYKDCHGAPAAADAKALLQEAQAAFAAGNRAAAEALSGRLLELAPTLAPAWNLLGEIRNPTDRAAAIDAWWRALSLDPGNAEASFHLGNREREDGAHGAAIIHYEFALRGAPQHAALLNNLGLSYKATGALDRAEASFRAALGAQPRHAEALINLAHLLFLRERYAEAIATVERLQALSPDLPPSLR